MRPRMWHTGLTHVGLAAIAVAPGTLRAQDTDSVRVHAVAAGIVQADNARALDDVLAFYAPHAILLPPNAAPVAGRTAIRPRYEALFRDYDPAIVTVIDEIVVRRDLAYVRGRNGGWLRGRDDKPDRALNDVYLMILRKNAEDEWRITRLIWHPGGA